MKLYVFSYALNVNDDCDINFVISDSERRQSYSPSRPERSQLLSTPSCLCTSPLVQSLSNHCYQPACLDHPYACTKKSVCFTSVTRERRTNTSATASTTTSGSPGSQSAHPYTRKCKYPCNFKWHANKPSPRSHKPVVEPTSGTRGFFQLPPKHAASWWTTANSTTIATYICSQFQPIPGRPKPASATLGSTTGSIGSKLRCRSSNGSPGLRTSRKPRERTIHS